jgi:hypothetical protein
MKDALAERLLAQVMGWTQEDVARERPDLQAMAAYKYDEYQQFSPGMRFVESLALWLSQFGSSREKQVAYDFVKKRVIFCSAAELSHLVGMAYPDYIRPLLLRKAASEAGYDKRQVAKVAGSIGFKVLQRQCLFLGLSDGARIDVFRRCNRQLSHEQIWQTYEIPGERVDNLLAELVSDIGALLGGPVPEEMRQFRTIVLLDDLSASGLSYLRQEDNGEFGGKIGKFHRSITTAGSPVARLVDIQRVSILIVLYMATEKASRHLAGISTAMWEPLGVNHSILVVHPLGSEICLGPGDGAPIEELLNAYYDPAIEDEHTRKGNTDLKYGFAGCGLPLVLSHNTPNNSLYLLWAESERLRALFPRVSRHRKET